MTFNRSNLTESEIHIIEWQYKLSDGFYYHLTNTMSLADEHNLDRMAIGFPDLANAMWNFHNTPNWWNDLKQRAEIN